MEPSSSDLFTEIQSVQRYNHKNTDHNLDCCTRYNVLCLSFSLKKVVGVAKLQKKVRQEIRFLERFLETEQRLAELKKEHIQCSNLVHLHSIIHQAVGHSRSFYFNY
jgi:hypothetical protein